MSAVLSVRRDAKVPAAGRLVQYTGLGEWALGSS